MRRGGALAKLWFALVLSAPGVAWADGRDPAAADALFQRGVDLLKKDQWAEACTAFEGSMKLDPSVGAQINIARCAEHQGNLAQAWEGFRKAKALNAETPLEKRKANVDAFVDTAIKKLEPRLPWVTVKLRIRPGADGKVPTPQSLAGLVVQRDDKPVPVEGLDVAVPIDPGKHVFRATAPHYKEARVEPYFIEGARQDAVLDLVFDPTAVAPPPPLVPPGNVPPPPVDSKKDEGTSPLLVTGIAVGSVGAGALIVSAITGGIAFSDHGTLDKLVKDHTCTETSGTIHCNTTQSSADAHSAISRGKTLSLVSTVTLFAGAGLAATGIVMAAVGATSHHGKKTPDVSFAPIVAPGVGGLVVVGGFE